MDRPVAPVPPAADLPDRDEPDWVQLDRSALRGTRRLRLGAILLAVLIAVSLPGLRATLWLQTAEEALHIEGDTLADAFSELASLRPDTWTFERNRLLSMLDVMTRRHAIDGAVLRDGQQREIALTGAPLSSSAFVREVPVLDSGVKVATVTVHMSTRGLWAPTAKAALLGALLGLATWWLIVRIVLARLESTVLQLQRARHEAERAGKARTAFLAAMSHEIRTPMNGVIGMTSLLLETPLSSTQRHYVDVIRGSGDSLLTVINDILEFTKVESTHIELESQRFQPETLADDVLALLGPAAAGKQIELACTVAPDVPEWLEADATRLRQVLVNVVANAVKFTPHGEVVVSVDCPAPGRLRYRVRDTGIGMSEAQIATVFDPFVQADASTTRRFGGTGLGLAISRRLARRMNGEVRVQSTPGQGSVFEIEVDAAATTAQVAIEADRRLDSLVGVRVLLVDDNQTNLEIVHAAVQGWGMRAIAQTDPRAALALVRDGLEVDLAILDFNMPHLDGADLARALQAVRPGLPMVLLSSSEGADQARGLFAARLHKPLRRRLLLETLLGVLGDTAASRAAAFHATVPAEIDSLGTLHALRVLVVEDNPVNAVVVRTMLERLGYQSDLAASGADAIAVLGRQPYDLVFMDMLMPEMDGLETTRRIRRLALAKQPRIVALTANVMQEDRQACAAAGMDDFLAKPVTLADLRLCMSESSNPEFALSATPTEALNPPFAGARNVGIRLRPTMVSDLDWVISIEQDRANRPFITPWERVQHEGALRIPDTRHFIVEAGPEAPRAGFVILQGLRNPHGSVELKRLVLDPAQQGRGLGRACVRLLARLAFDDYHAHRFWLDVKSRNTRALALYASEGFVEEGRLRESVRVDGGFDSLVVMSMLAQDYAASISAEPAGRQS